MLLQCVRPCGGPRPRARVTGSGTAGLRFGTGETRLSEASGLTAFFAET